MNHVDPRHSAPTYVDFGGRCGATASDGAAGRIDGGDGGDAGVAERGADAAHLDVRLHSDPASPTLLRLVGQRRDAWGTRATAVELAVPADRPLWFRGNGGDGGDGGRGGDGGHGAAGLAGQDACPAYPATDGGPGGRGGEAGRGSHGAAGGAGGALHVRVAATDAELLAGVVAETRGGHGGRPGAHGAPGAGGAGGKGGAGRMLAQTAANCPRRPGYAPLPASADAPPLGDGHRCPDGRRGHYRRHWTTSCGADVDRTPQPASDAVASPGRWQPGGHPGLLGAPGRHRTEALHAGADGRPGSVRYTLTDAVGARTYDDLFAVTLHGLALAPRAGRRVIAFGDCVDAQLFACNPMRMPTPHAGALTAALRLEGAGQATTVASAPLPGAMAEGRAHAVAGLSFVVPWPDAAPGPERAQVSHRLVASVRAERTGLVLEGAAAAAAFTATSPLAIAALTWEPTAQRDAPARVRWQVDNLGDQPVGGDLHRARVSLCLTGGDVPGITLAVTGAGRTETVTAAAPYMYDVPLLAPGSSATCEATLSFHAATPLHARAELHCELALARTAGGAASATVQARPLAVQLAAAYRDDPLAQLLLVINAATTREEVAAWQAVARQLGTAANVWNMSLYGDVSLTRTIAGTDLAAACRDRLVVLLNNAVATAAGVDHAWAHLTTGELLQAVRAGGSSTYVVTPEPVDLTAQLRPIATGPGSRHASPSAFLRAHACGQAGVATPRGSDRVEISCFAPPTLALLAGEARALLARLRACEPTHTYVVDATLAPRRSRLCGGISGWRAGWLDVARGLDLAQRAVVEHTVPPARLHAPDFVLGADNRAALCRALPFGRKLTLLGRVAGTGQPIEASVVAGIVADLRDEQTALRAQAWQGGLPRARLAARLERLAALAAHPFADATRPSSRRDVLLHLHAEIAAMQTRRWRDTLLPWRRGADVDAATAAYLAMFTRATLGDVLSDATEPPAHAAGASDAPCGATRVELAVRDAVSAPTARDRQASGT